MIIVVFGIILVRIDHPAWYLGCLLGGFLIWLAYRFGKPPKDDVLEKNLKIVEEASAALKKKEAELAALEKEKI